MRLHPSHAAARKKALPKNLPAKSEGGGAPKSASNHWPRRPARVAAHRPSPRRASIGTRSPFGAPPRLSPEARRPIGSTPGHASWDADLAGVTRLRLSQSRESTSRTGRSTGMNDAQSRPGAGRNAARGDRSRSTFESTLAKGPSANEMLNYVTINATNVNRWSHEKRRGQCGPANPSGVGCRISVAFALV
jgi:hypothetical protein